MVFGCALLTLRIPRTKTLLQAAAIDVYWLVAKRKYLRGRKRLRPTSARRLGVHFSQSFSNSQKNLVLGAEAVTILT
jgi:hypothetical protein